jgi:hypothetical protein
MEISFCKNPRYNGMKCFESMHYEKFTSSANIYIVFYCEWIRGDYINGQLTKIC